MIGSLVIVFREVLEAALVVGVVAAAVKGLPRRGRLVSAGIALGISGAAIIAAGLGVISRLAHGNGQEVFEASVLFAAGVMLAWHNVYMAKHGREMTQRLKTLGGDVVAGRASATMLVGVTAIAVMREGSEVALFLYALAAGGAADMSLLGGSLIGLACGVAVGFVLFAGLSRIPIKRLFQVSGWIILFIAAGMVARGAQFLIQANFLPPLINRVWDSSTLLSGSSIAGRSLEALAGYTPSPSLMQILFWTGSFTLISGLMLVKSGRFSTWRRRRVFTVLALLAVGAAAMPWSLPAHAADYQVYSPNVVLGESEIEARGFTSWGSNPQSGAQKSMQLAFGHAFTPWWATEFYATSEKEYGENLKLEEFEWENRFQLTPQGRYWADIGILNENEIPRFGGDPFVIRIGPTFEKDVGRYTAILDVLAAHQYGADAKSGIALQYRARLEYRWRRHVSPMIEAYGEPIGRTGRYGNPRNQIGPGITGRVLVGPGKSLRYAAVALIGTTHAAANGTLVLRLEYEFY